MTEEGQKKGLVAIRDYIPSDCLCYICNENNCDRFDVKGFSHQKCQVN